MHRTVVNHGIDISLDEMNETYSGLEDLLNLTSKNIAATVPVQHGLDLNVIFFPQIGYLISIPLDPNTNRGTYEGGDSSEGRWDRIFSTENRVYYKDFRMRELDTVVGDLYSSICGKLRTLHPRFRLSFSADFPDREIEIVHELAQEVLKNADVLSSTSDICAELDW